MADIKKLLNKRGWTGRELGILEVTNMAVMFREALAGQEPKGIVSQAQLQKMINGIKEREQGVVYNGYISIHEWLSLKYNIAQTQFQQAQLQYRTIEHYVSQAILSEDVYQYVEQLPAIMTQKQLDDLRAERLEAYFKTEDGEELYSNIFNLVERAISFYLRKLREEPAKHNPLKAIRKKYVSQPVKSKLIRSRWNELMGEGYYTIEDGSGRRSDQMTAEEWQEAITTPTMKKALRDTRATDGSGTVLTQQVAAMRLIDRAKVIFDGGTEEEADKDQQRKDYERGLATPVKWHYYEEAPADLMKWDVIEQELLLELYPADLDGSGDEYSESNFTASMEDFVAEFTELVKAMLADMDKKYFSGDEVQASQLSISEWFTTSISWRRLYELDFYGEKAIAEADTQTFSGNRRALFNGIAIVRASDLLHKSRLIDERGYYVEPKIKTALSNYSLEAFFPEADKYTENTETIEEARETLLDSLYFLRGYNLALDMTAEYYDIPDIAVFKAHTDRIEEQIDAINGLIPILYRQIKDTDYQDKELQARKLEVLRDFFGEIDYTALVIPEENIQEAKELIAGFKAYTGQFADRFYNLLCIRASEDEEDEGGY